MYLVPHQNFWQQKLSPQAIMQHFFCEFDSVFSGF